MLLSVVSKDRWTSLFVSLSEPQAKMNLSLWKHQLYTETDRLSFWDPQSCFLISISNFIFFSVVRTKYSVTYAFLAGILRLDETSRPYNMSTAGNLSAKKTHSNLLYKSTLGSRWALSLSVAACEAWRKPCGFLLFLSLWQILCKMKLLIFFSKSSES